VSTRASNAIVVISFRMFGFQSWAPHDDGNGKLDHKLRQASRFVQDPPARGRCRKKTLGIGLGVRAWHHPDDER
jgi:hypothetical protein